MKNHLRNAGQIKIVLLAAPLLMICLWSCRKGDNSTPVATAVMRYFFYSPGTFWVYRDSITGDIDSICVYKSDLHVATSNSNYDIRMSNFNMYTNNLESGGGYFSYQYSAIGYTNYFESDSTRLDDQEYLFSYPFYTSQSNIDGNSSGDVYTYLESVQSYSLNGNVFDSVAEINHSDSGKTYSDRFFISKAAGIVKIRINHYPHLKVLELERYKIIH